MASPLSKTKHPDLLPFLPEEEPGYAQHEKRINRTGLSAVKRSLSLSFPLPDLSAFSSPPGSPTVKATLPACPSAPRHKRSKSFSFPEQHPSQEISIDPKKFFFTNAHFLSQHCPSLGTSITVEGKKYTIAQYLGKGSFGKAWRAEIATTGESKVLKFFHDKILDKPEGEVLSYLQEELIQYCQLASSFPVARYYSWDPLLTNPNLQEIASLPPEGRAKRGKEILPLVKRGIGFYVTEYIPEEFLKKRASLPASETVERGYYEQLKNMFHALFERQIAGDLTRENVGIKDKKVVYFDLMPQDETFGTENPFLPLVEKCLTTFAEKDSELYRWLDPRINAKKSAETAS